jgi:hypothetical protein
MKRRASDDGEVVPSPTKPFLFVPPIIKEGLELASFATTNAGLLVVSSTESFAHGEVVGIPTAPAKVLVEVVVVAVKNCPTICPTTESLA